MHTNQITMIHNYKQKKIGFNLHFINHYLYIYNINFSNAFYTEIWSKAYPADWALDLLITRVIISRLLIFTNGQR